MARAALEIFNSFVGLIAGLFLAFSGYRLAKNFAALAGFLVGFVVGLVVGIVAGPIGALIIAVVSGVIFALLFLFAFRLVGGALGAAAGYLLAVILGFAGWGVLLVAIVGGVLGLIANKIAIIVATSWLGAGLAVRSGVELLGDLGATALSDDTIILVATLLLAALGAFVQWRSLRHEA